MPDIRALEEVSRLKAELSKSHVETEKYQISLDEEREKTKQLEATVKELEGRKGSGILKVKRDSNIRELKLEVDRERGMRRNLEMKMDQMRMELGDTMERVRRERVEAADVAQSRASELEGVRNDLELERKANATLRKQVSARNTEVVVDSHSDKRMRDLNSQLKRAKEDTLEREREIDRLSREMTALNERMIGKDQKIVNLTKELSNSLAVAPKENMKLKKELERFERKSDKIDADMEVMEENLRLQAEVTEKDAVINKLKKELAMAGTPIMKK